MEIVKLLANNFVYMDGWMDGWIGGCVDGLI